MWFATVEDKREDGRSTSSSGSDHDQTDQPRETAENDHARFLRQAME